VSHSPDAIGKAYVSDPPAPTMKVVFGVIKRLGLVTKILRVLDSHP